MSDMTPREAAQLSGDDLATWIVDRIEGPTSSRIRAGLHDDIEAAIGYRDATRAPAGPDPDLVEAFRSARLTKPEAERLAAVAARHTADALAAERDRIRDKLYAKLDDEPESYLASGLRVAILVVDPDTGGER